MLAPVLACTNQSATAMQALSKRIHYGKFVAEAKFQSQTAKYTELIQRGDVEGIMDALTDRAVELKVPLCPAAVQKGAGLRG
jgi:chorismate mutase